MADDLNVILKAQLDVNETAKEINIQLDQLEGKIQKLGIDINLDDVAKKFNDSINKVKTSVNEISTAFGNVNVGNKFSKGFDELNSRVKEVRANVDSLAKVKIGLGIDVNGEGRVENALLTYKNDMGQIVTETMKWQNTFDEIGNITGQQFRSTFENVTDNIVGANNQLEKQKKLYTEIKAKLDSLPQSAIGTNETQDMYSMLDSSTSVEDLQTLKGMTNSYYSDAMALEKQYTQQRKNDQADIIASLKEEQQAKEFMAKVETSQNKLTAIKTEYSGADVAKIRETSDALTQLAKDVETGNISMDDANIKYKKLTNSIGEIDTSAKKASASTATWSSRLARVFQFTMFYRGISMAQEGIREMISTVSDLDKALVDLQKVSTLSGNSLDNFTQQAYSLGAQISKAGSDVIKSATEFAKSDDYTEAELLQLSKSALILTSIGDGLTNTKEAASTIIAVMKGFKKNTEDVAHVLDSVNEISNRTAVDFSNLTFALSRMSGTMNQSGVDMEQSMGLFTAIDEVLKNEEMVSTALNTISMRIRGLEEDGTKIDGLTPKLANMFKTMADIDMTDADGQLKNLFEITSELAPKWDGLTENQRQYFAQQIAG